MTIVTLTTDWGTKDFYLANVKGGLLKAIPQIQIVDISHQIPSFDIYQASFVLKNSYKSFPANTIHIIGVNSESSIETPHIVIFHENQYFIGADNGIFSLIFDEKPTKIVEIDIIQESDKFTFSTKDVFVKVSQHIASGKPLDDLGFVKDSIHKLMSFEPIIESDNETTSIIGKVIYIDRYENAITNIRKTLFDEVGKGRRFTISFNSFNNNIKQISQSYGDVAISEMLAVFGTNDLLEIAINQGNAGSLLGLRFDSKVRISFLKM
ncbi:MAG: SAM-dependent chlorinase/fluorinase [Bacteroidales bacterium]|nr:SAM-dependent chlorinase/fluorinase [Bacteroidales bacterium]